MRDVDAAPRFHASIEPATGFVAPGTLDDPRRVLFRSPTASFSLVAGPPTEHVHLAFADEGRGLVRDPDGNTLCVADSLCTDGSAE